MSNAQNDPMATFVPDSSHDARPAPASAADMQTVVPQNETTVGERAATPATGTDAVLQQLRNLAAAGQLDFKDITKLGEGGMGLVCRAHQVSLDRPVALKVLKQELADNPNLVERFVREARAMAKINHPNVVQGYAVGETGGLNWVAMELIHGESMQDALDREGPLPLSDAALITVVAAEALQHAHDLKMIHRDIKPDNILVTADGQIKVADLGLAKATDEDMSMTQSGTGLGTPHYMPPEQARNAKHVDFRSDIYALGCTLYHFLTGGVPFAGESVVELIMNKEKGSFPPVRRNRPDCPERLALVVDKMMAAKPEHRYDSMNAVIADIQKLGLVGETLSFVPGAAPVRRSVNAPTIAATSPATTGATMSGDRVARLASSQKPKKTAAKPGDSGTIWYLKIANPDGSVRKVKAPHGEVLAKLRSNQLDPATTEIASKPKGPYLTLAQVPAFSDELGKRARKKKHAKKPGMNKEFAKLNKQYGRRKFWRMLGRAKDGTLGLLSLVIYLGAFAVVGFGIYAYLPEIKAVVSGDAAPAEATVEASESTNAATPR